MDNTILASSLLALVLYLNTLDSDFAYDDSRAIQKNQDLLPETPLSNIFFDDFWGTPLTLTASHKSYRPLCVLTFRLNYYLGELNPWGYHLGNVLFHVVTTAAFTYTSRIFLKQSIPTLISGLLFASHPVHTEAVAGVVGRADVMSCLFFILSLLSYMKYVEVRDLPSDHGAHGWTRFVVFLCTAIFTTASMLSKEQGLTVLAVCLTYDFFVHNKMKIQDIFQFYKVSNHRRAMEGLVLLVGLGLSLLTFRVYFMGNKPPEFAPSDNPASDSDSLITRTLTYFLLPSLDFWILLCPRVLSFDWSMESIPLVESVSDYRNLFTVVFYSSLGYMAYYILSAIHRPTKHKPYMNGNGVSNHIHSNISSKTSHSKLKPIHRSLSRRDSSSSAEGDDNSARTSQSLNVMILSLAIMIFPFIPATNLFFYVGFVVAERVLYIPSMGFCLLVAQGVYVIYKKYKSDDLKQKLLAAAVLGLVGLYSVKTVTRNVVWTTEENLYSSGLSVNPPKAWGNLANIYNSQGKIKEAEEAYRNALKYRSNMADTHYNLGILLQNQKRTEESIESYKKAIHFRPKLSMAYLNLGIVMSSQGQKEEAIKIYRHCADLDTSILKDPRLHETTKISCLYNLGRVYFDLERNKESIEAYQEALRRMPPYYAAQSLYNMYGETLAKVGQLDEAEKMYMKALGIKPDHLPAFLTMAKLEQKRGNMEKAASWYERAKELHHEDEVMLQHHYAQFLSEIGKKQEAAKLYLQTVDKAPDDFELTLNAATVLREVSMNEEAERLHRRAVQIRPDVPTALMNLGAILHMNGKLEEAEASYLKALKLKPDDKTTQLNLEKLRNLMKSSKAAGKKDT